MMYQVMIDETIKTTFLSTVFAPLIQLQPDQMLFSIAKRIF